MNPEASKDPDDKSLELIYSQVFSQEIFLNDQSLHLNLNQTLDSLDYQLTKTPVIFSPN